jgi:alpha-tubulin suppressor-like RCC1 family protein
LCLIEEMIGYNKIISCRYFHTVVITSERKIVCYGSNEKKQCDVPEDLNNVTQIIRTTFSKFIGTSH